MALGRTHTTFNLMIGSLSLGLLLGAGFDLKTLGCFALGFWFSTFVFSPDTDLGPRKPAGILRPFLYPYSLFFRHRGLSHSLLWGTLTRTVYILGVITCMVYVLNSMGKIEITLNTFWKSLLVFIQNYDYSLTPYRLGTWALIGMFFSDFLHLFLDHFTSTLKKLKPW